MMRKLSAKVAHLSVCFGMATGCLVDLVVYVLHNGVHRTVSFYVLLVA